MGRFLLLLLLLQAAPVFGGQPVLEPYEAPSGAWGYETPQHQPAIAPRFLLAGPFSEHGIAPVVDEQGWAIIDEQGRVLLRPFVFDNGPDPFQEGLARFVAHGKMGFFNEQGRIVIAPEFDFAEPFSEGRAAFCTGCSKEHHGEHWRMQGGLWGCIDRSGTVVRQPQAAQRDCSSP